MSICQKCIHKYVCKNRSSDINQELAMVGCGGYLDYDILLKITEEHFKKTNTNEIKRFVEHFWISGGGYDRPVEERINSFAEDNNLKIITIAPLYTGGMYVLFETQQETN